MTGCRRWPNLADEFGISRPTLREALRILEMEFLLDLRTGDRGGATIRTPSTRVAAQQAGIVLEARRTTLLDFHRALHVIEPTIMGMVATRINARQLAVLHGFAAELACLHRRHRARFVTTWRDAEKSAFAAVKNPALTVIAEILHWVRVVVEPTVDRRRQGVTRRRDLQSPRPVHCSHSSSTPPPSTTPAEAARLWRRRSQPTAPWLEKSGHRLSA